MKVITLDIGDNVICDICNGDWTGRLESGGLLFGSSAICPECAPKFEMDVRRYNEQRFIKARCPAGKSFADWVRQDLRGGNNQVRLIG